jgi:hypothetical protein
MNYTELSDAIVAETENTDTTFLANVPVFIKNAEKRIYQAVKIPALRANKTSTFTQNNQYVTLPTDFLAPWEFAVIQSGTYSYLLLKDVSFIREAYPSPTNTGIPKYYAVFDENTAIVAPTPNATLANELHYFYYPESIITAVNTWLGDNFEGVLFYGALLEAAVFMKSEEDTVKVYSEQFLSNLKLLKAYSDGKLRSGNYRE